MTTVKDTNNIMMKRILKKKSPDKLTLEQKVFMFENELKLVETDSSTQGYMAIEGKHGKTLVCSQDYNHNTAFYGGHSFLMYSGDNNVDLLAYVNGEIRYVYEPVVYTKFERMKKLKENTASYKSCLKSTEERLAKIREEFERKIENEERMIVSWNESIKKFETEMNEIKESIKK